jgi:hypothetical protein
MITVLGSNQSKRIMAENPQDAIELAFNTKIGITWVDVKNTPNAKYNVRAELLGGKKKSVNYYLVDFKQIENPTPADNKAQTRQTIADMFKAEAKKEKDRQVSAVENYSQEEIEALAGKASVKKVYNKLVKEGKSGAELNRAIAREIFKKNSKMYEEMIMQAENLTDNYEIVDIKNPQAVLNALAKYPCMVLAKKAGGGVTGWFGTTNLAVVESIYGKSISNLYTLVKLTEVYTDLFNISTRKLNLIKSGNERPMPPTKHKIYQVASCEIRLKEDTVTNRSTGLLEPTGKLIVSSSTYGFPMEYLLGMVAYKDVAPVDKTLIDVLSKEAFNSSEDFNNKYKFNKAAYTMAIQTIKEGNLPLAFEATFDEEVNRQGVSKEDAELYWNAKQTGFIKQLLGIIEESKRGSTLYAAPVEE